MATSDHVAIRAFARAAGTLSRVLAVVSVVAIVFVMSIVVLDVTRRNLGFSSVRGAIDYAEVGLVVVAFFALGETQRRGDHVSVDAILNRLPQGSRRALRILGQLLGVVVAGLLSYGAYELFVNSLLTGEYRLGLVRVTVWPARLGVFAGFLAWSLQLLVVLLEPEDPVAGDLGETAVL